MKEKADVSWRRSIGFVAKIRLNPKDVMTCIDAVQKVHVDMTGASLPAVVKRGISIVLETMRREGILPTRDGFEYEEMTAPFEQNSRKLKIDIGHKLVVQDQQTEQYDLPRPALPVRPIVSDADLAQARKIDRLMRKRKEMVFRKEHGGKGNWTAKDERDLIQLEQEMVQ